VLEDHLLAGVIAADRSENPGECAGVTVWREVKGVVEFFPDISNPGERGVPGDPGEGECNEFLPAFREGFLENREEILELFRGGSGTGVRRAPLRMRPSWVRRPRYVLTFFGDLVALL
jgi:hypothetical protein